VFDHFYIMFVHSEDTFVRIIRPDKMKQRNPIACRIVPFDFILNLLQHSLRRDKIREHTKEQSIKMSVNIADKIECK